jgi:hypothetical protein
MHSFIQHRKHIYKGVVLTLLTALHLIQFADVKCYPTFSNLKTLLLDDRCLSADLRPLIYILQHSRVLENLTIELTVHTFPYV